MKKLTMIFVVWLLFPMQTLAAGEERGVYVAPKFVYGIETFKMKAQTEEGIGWSDGAHSDDVFGGALALGYDFSARFNLPLRAELEYALFSRGEREKYFTWTDEDGAGSGSVKGKIDVQSLFVNVYYDFHNESKFTPYVGGGLGLGFVGMKASASGADADGPYESGSLGKKNRTNFAWNLGLGCAYEVTDNFALDLGYRYADFGKAETKSYADPDEEGQTYVKGKSEHVGMHQFMLAARFTF